MKHVTILRALPILLIILAASRAEATFRATPTGPILAAVAPHARVAGEIRRDVVRTGERQTSLNNLRGGPYAPVMVRRGVLFRYDDENAVHVSVVGEFNNWDPLADRMRRRRDGIWRATIDLDPGRWAYLIAVDGEWIRDPDNPVRTVADEGEAGGDLGEVSMVHIVRGEVALPRPHGFHEAETHLTSAYDRVNQITLNAILRYRNRVQMHPDLDVAGGYSFGRERWLYDIGLTQPLIGPELLDIGGMAFRRNATPDAFRFGQTENSLATFFFRQDWYDHHETEGVSAHANLHVGPDLNLGVLWKQEDHRSVEKTTDWGVFEGGKRMRVNGPVTEGELRSLATFYELDTRNHPRNPTRGFLAHATWEWAGGEFGGDFEFRRGIADIRRYVKLSPYHFFDIRLRGGAIDEARRTDDDGTRLEGFEAIPVQERFKLGGIGTMRATQFKSLAGDRMFLANVEMRVEVFEDFQVVLFGDFGDAWVEDGRDFDLKTDAGIGFQDSDANFRVNFARKMDDRGSADDSIFLSARIDRMF